MADDSLQPVDLEHRFLCADGGCIGTIGSDGRCKICSTPIAPEDVEAFERATATPLDDSFARATTASASEGTEVDDANDEDWDDDEDTGGAPPELESRVLCPDGSCIGVVGPDGRCKVCGTSANDEVSSGD